MSSGEIQNVQDFRKILNLGWLLIPPFLSSILNRQESGLEVMHVVPKRALASVTWAQWPYLGFWGYTSCPENTFFEECFLGHRTRSPSWPRLIQWLHEVGRVGNRELRQMEEETEAQGSQMTLICRLRKYLLSLLSTEQAKTEPHVS